MPTIANEYKEMYGNKQPFGNANMAPNNLLKKIVPNQEFNNNVTSNYNKNLNKPLTEDINPSNSEFPYFFMFMAMLFLGIGILMYYYKDKIYNLYEELIKPKIEEEPPIKQDVLPEKIESKQIAEKEPDKPPEKNIKEKEKEQNEKNKKIKEGGLNELNKKLNANYSQDQIVKENSYCYIGYENGQRECTNVFDGDICMSGEIFPKMDICINPRLRA